MDGYDSHRHHSVIWPHTPMRIKRSVMETPSPCSRHARNHTDTRHVQSERICRVGNINVSPVKKLPPAAPVLQSNSELTSIYFGTPTSAERCATHDLVASGFCDRSTPNDDSDLSSPGMGRAASPVEEVQARRTHIRGVLGDVSNLSPAPSQSPLKKTFSPNLSVRSTPLRHSTNLALGSTPTRMTPVQSALQGWASSRFERSMPCQDVGKSASLSSPVKSSTSLADHSPDAVPESASMSPLKSHKMNDSANATFQVENDKATRPAPLYRSSTSMRLDARRLGVSPHRLPQRVPGFVPASASPAKRVKVCASPVSNTRNGALSGPNLLHAASPAQLSQDGLSSSPTKAARLVRPVKYTNHAPAMRVWDSTEKMESKRVVKESSAPLSIETEHSPVKSTASMKSTPESSKRSMRQASRVVAEPPKTLRNSTPPPRVLRSSTAVNRTPRTPRRAQVPPHPPISAMELTRLTTKHTKQNEMYNVQLEMRTHRIPGPRPPSPSQRFVAGQGQRAKEQFMPALAETNEYGEPICHALGAGDEDEYTTPPGKNVRWDRRLVVSPSVKRQAMRSKRDSGCLVHTPLALDAFGNVACPPLKNVSRRKVLVKRFVYDDDEDQDV